MGLLLGPAVAEADWVGDDAAVAVGAVTCGAQFGWPTLQAVSKRVAANTHSAFIQPVFAQGKSTTRPAMGNSLLCWRRSSECLRPLEQRQRTPEPSTSAATSRSIVSALGQCGSRVGGFGATRPTETKARAVLRRAIELGVNFIDTADSYGPNVSEELIAEALHPYPDDLVIATKGGLVRPGPGRWPADGRPEHLREACEGSLRRLQVDQIALYQFHRQDPAVRFEASIGALVTLKDEGKIRHIGLSNVNEDQLRRAQALTPIVSIQNRYNPGDRRSDALVDLCASEQIAFLPWAPIQNLDQLPTLTEIADRHGATPYQVALAWLLARSETMLTIPGTGSIEHLEENVAAAGLQLDAKEITVLNELG